MLEAFTNNITLNDRILQFRPDHEQTLAQRLFQKNWLAKGEGVASCDALVLFFIFGNNVSIKSQISPKFTRKFDYFFNNYGSLNT